MCLYPRLVQNPKYKPNKKNGGNPPPLKDRRTAVVPVGCGMCSECKKKKKREWQVRLSEEVKDDNTGIFVTLTFSTEALKELDKEIQEDVKGYERENRIVTLAVRRFLERWRKKYKKSVKHWLVTEIGGGRYEHIHVHGILWTVNYESIEEIWKYGYIWEGKSRGKKVGGKAVNYILKYVNKIDIKHPNYKSIVLTSKGIGKKYIEKNKKKRGDKDYYRTETGHKIALPVYYRNGIYTDEEREKLWIKKLDEDVRYVGGKKVKGSDSVRYIKLREEERRRDKRLNYQSPRDIKKADIEYENKRRDLLLKERLQKETEELKEYEEKIKLPTEEQLKDRSYWSNSNFIDKDTN